MTLAVVAKIIHTCHLETVYTCIYYVVSLETSLKHRMDEFIVLACILIFVFVCERLKFTAATNAGGCLQPVIIEMMHLKMENVCIVPNNIIK